MWTYNNTNELYHYGVLGMKWGRRRTKAQLAKARKSREKSSIKDMPDDELRRKINRLQMEQQYKKLSGTDVSRGKQFVKNAVSATTTIAALTTAGVTIYKNADKIKSLMKAAKLSQPQWGSGPLVKY